jgi:hypothetical protein
MIPRGLSFLLIAFWRADCVKLPEKFSILHLSCWAMFATQNARPHAFQEYWRSKWRPENFGLVMKTVFLNRSLGGFSAHKSNSRLATRRIGIPQIPRYSQFAIKCFCESVASLVGFPVAAGDSDRQGTHASTGAVRVPEFLCVRLGYSPTVMGKRISS